MAALSGAAVAWPVTALAQQARRCRPSGSWVLTVRRGSMDCCFVGRLRELGWIEGRTVAFEYRLGRTPRARPRDRGRVRPPKVEVIVAYGGAVTT
jgi:hypothetical protein